MASVEPEAVIIADGTTVYPLWYEQEVKGGRKDVEVISLHGGYVNAMEYPTTETIDSILEERAVYVVSPVSSYCPGYLIEKYNLTCDDLLYRVRPAVE